MSSAGKGNPPKNGKGREFHAIGASLSKKEGDSVRGPDSSARVAVGGVSGADRENVGQKGLGMSASDPAIGLKTRNGEGKASSASERDLNVESSAAQPSAKGKFVHTLVAKEGESGVVVSQKRSNGGEPDIIGVLDTLTARPGILKGPAQLDGLLRVMKGAAAFSTWEFALSIVLRSQVDSYDGFTRIVEDGKFVSQLVLIMKKSIETSQTELLQQILNLLNLLPMTLEVLKESQIGAVLNMIREGNLFGLGPSARGVRTKWKSLLTASSSVKTKSATSTTTAKRKRDDAVAVSGDMDAVVEPPQESSSTVVVPGKRKKTMRVSWAPQESLVTEHLIPAKEERRSAVVLSSHFVGDSGEYRAVSSMVSWPPPRVTGIVTEQRPGAAVGDVGRPDLFYRFDKQMIYSSPEAIPDSPISPRREDDFDDSRTLAVPVSSSAVLPGGPGDPSAPPQPAALPVLETSDVLGQLAQLIGSGALSSGLNVRGTAPAAPPTTTIPSFSIDPMSAPPFGTSRAMRGGPESALDPNVAFEFALAQHLAASGGSNGMPEEPSNPPAFPWADSRPRTSHPVRRRFDAFNTRGPFGPPGNI